MVTGILLITVLGIQLIHPAIEQGPVTGEIAAPAPVRSILLRACYDCHSNETKLGWADQIAPVYWLVAAHVNSGRSHLNFSEWNKLSPAEQKTKLWESVNHISLGAMPRGDYTFIHPSAKVSAEEIALLRNYLNTMIDNKPADTIKINAEDKQFNLWTNGGGRINKLPVAPNGIPYDPDYKKWQPLSTSDRFESGTMRVIFGNDIAIQAVKENNTRPWPDGARIAKVLWSQLADEQGNVRTGAFVQLDLMIKDKEKYASTGGWGFARFKTLQMIPYGKNAAFATECINCHRPMKNEDFVFTIPIKR